MVLVSDLVEIETDSVARPEHCFYCFDVLSAQLTGRELPDPKFEDKDIEYPLFVTWNTTSSSSSSVRLRGCIGNFEPMPLGTGLKDYAIISAMKDKRFSPVQERELRKLECGVSLLTDFEVCADPYDWTVGTHGIYIHFPNPTYHPPPVDSGATTPATPDSNDSASSSNISLPSNRKTKTILNRFPFTSSSLWNKGPNTLSATYLPDVPSSQGWDQVQTLDSAIRKAGWNGRIDDTLRSTLRVTRYQSSKYSVSYSEWVQSRQ